MSLIIPANSLSGGYAVDNSCRFNDGSSDGFSLSGQNGNRKTFTFSCWVKRGVFGENFLFNSRIDASNHFLTRFTGAHQLELVNRTSASNNFFVTTNRLFRDVSAWYHIVVAVDTTQSTANDRVKFYVNGVQETSFATQTIGSQNADLSLNVSTATHYIGQENISGYNFFDGYMAETVLIDGQALDPTSFGEFDADSGIWKPISVSGLTFGTNGFYLDFEDSSALGADVSGNGNNFTVNNLTAVDQSTDTCTNNFATLNPVYKSSSQPTFSEGNLRQAPNTTTYQNAFSTIGVTSGKWYVEMKVNGTANSANYFGVSAETEYDYLQSNGNVIGTTDKGYSIAMASGDKRTNGSNSSYGSAIADTDIFMIALDIDNAKVWFGKNGTWFASGDPASGSNPAFSSINTAYPYFFGGAVYTAGYTSVDWNFGNPPFTISSGNADADGYGNFEYAVPSGYYALNTKNLAEYG